MNEPVQTSEDGAPIYLIADVYDRDDYEEVVLDPDYGYYATREEADAFANGHNGPIQAKWQLQMDDYTSRRAAWDEREAQAKALGFKNPDFTPYPPNGPYGLVRVIEVKQITRDEQGHSA